MTEKERKKGNNRPSERVGVYICRCGGNISDHVDIEKVRERAESMPGVSVARINTFMCSDPGQEMIVEDLRSGKADRIVVASCAPDLHEMTFRKAITRAGWNPYLYEHANIREQVSWVHQGQAATDKATRLVAAAVAKAGRLKPLEPLKVDAIDRAAIIGGGVAGLKAAKDLADRDFSVDLIERSPFLGGRTAMLDTLSPWDEKASDVVSGLALDVMQCRGVTIHTCARVTSFNGYIGNFRLSVKKAPPGPQEYAEELERFNLSGRAMGEFVPFAGICPEGIPEKETESIIETGIVILATGFEPYRPSMGEYGYKRLTGVVTLPELIKKTAGGDSNGRCLRIDGREIRSVAMIHCVGSRQVPGIHPEGENGKLNEYCSRVCCSATLHAAHRIREENPGTRVYEYYRDIRAYGRGQEELYERAASKGVVFLRYEADNPPEVTTGDISSGYPLKVIVKDTLTFGEEVEVPVDLAVLSVGMVPCPINDLAEMMKLPVGTDGFLQEIHPKLGPVELSVSGIFSAGTCQAPMDAGESCCAGGAAAVKASGILCRGSVTLHPFVAEVDPALCKGSGACVEACVKDGALRLVEVEIDEGRRSRAQVFPALCSGCGACAAVCPENAININGWTLDQYEAMVDVIADDSLIP